MYHSKWCVCVCVCVWPGVSCKGGGIPHKPAGLCPLPRPPSAVHLSAPPPLLSIPIPYVYIFPLHSHGVCLLQHRRPTAVPLNMYMVQSPGDPRLGSSGTPGKATPVFFWMYAQCACAASPSWEYRRMRGHYHRERALSGYDGGVCLQIHTAFHVQGYRVKGHGG